MLRSLLRCRNARQHLRALVTSVKSGQEMLRAMRKKDWARFAKRYNGPAHHVKGYDKRIENAYDRLLKERASKKPRAL